MLRFNLMICSLFKVRSCFLWEYGYWSLLTCNDNLQLCSNNMAICLFTCSHAIVTKKLICWLGNLPICFFSIYFSALYFFLACTFKIPLGKGNCQAYKPFRLKQDCGPKTYFKTLDPLQVENKFSYLFPSNKLATILYNF